MGKFVLVLLLVAVLVYGVLRLLDKRRSGASSPGRSGRPRRLPPSRPAAPDDDEDFLRGLDGRRLHNDEDPDQPPAG